MPAQSRIANLSNASIANTVRSNMINFGDRIPAATQGNMKDVLKSIQSYRPAWNEWLEVFLDVCALPLYHIFALTLLLLALRQSFSHDVLRYNVSPSSMGRSML